MATYCCTSGQVSKMQPVHTVVYRMQQKSSAFVFLLGVGGGGGGVGGGGVGGEVMLHMKNEQLYGVSFHFYL